jgi:hypothetical protein
MEGKNIEKERTREQLVEEAKEIIYQNLMSSGLAEDIVNKSAHAQSFSADLYNSVEFTYYMGAASFKEGIWAQPMLSTSAQLQPVTPKLYRLQRKDAEQIIWAGVDSDHKKALIETAIHYQKAVYQRNRASVEEMRDDGESESVIDWTISDANEHLLILEKLSMGLGNDSLEQVIDPKYGALGVKVKE